MSSCLCSPFSLPPLLVQGLACGVSCHAVVQCLLTICSRTQAQENLSSKLWNWVKQRPLGVWPMLERYL